MDRKQLLSQRALHIILNRLSWQLLENHGDFSQSVLIGLQPRGVTLLRELVHLLQKQGLPEVPQGTLDITFFRDDFRRREEPLQANRTEINILLEGKKVIFVDDVLFTGRSVRAAMDAIQSFGRPAEIELLVLIDRRFTRELPIQPDYIGRQVDSLTGDRVQVSWQQDGAPEDAVYLEKNKIKI